MASPGTSTGWHAVIPAAGEGTRLRPLTEDRPKPLVEVAGRPLLAHVFDALEPIDPRSYVVVVGYRGEQVREHFGDEYDGAPIEYVDQPEPLGLADAVGRAETEVDGQFVVCNGDNVFADDLAPLADAHESTAERPGEPPAATMLVEDATREAARETGVVVTDDAGRVQRVVEKPDDPPPDEHRESGEHDRTSAGRTPGTLISAGAFAATPAIFEAIDAIEPADRGEYEIADALTWLVERGRAVETLRHAGERVNVNDFDDLERAEALLASR